MPTEDAAQKLAEFIKTTKHRQELLAQIEALLQDSSKITSYPKIRTLLLDLNPESLVDLKNRVQKVDEVTINTAANLSNPPESLLDTAYTWCKTDVSPCSIVGILPTANITAGLTCSYKGHYRDFSLDKIIKERVYA